ncbi:hypothetical protein JQN58_34980 [Aneurinibacillus sp. BA2021]|nr:hypothetical protein [Aneurinibacillus sp. BA2021]
MEVAPIPTFQYPWIIMNNTLKYAAGVFALASATWSFTAGNFWPGLLAVVAAGLIIVGIIRSRDEEA